MKIPTGYRKLKPDEMIESGDKWCGQGKWIESEYGSSYTPYQMGQDYIRKVSPVKRAAKQSCKDSLQRRVGRSASDGQPEAVARPIGRKKAVQPPSACKYRANFLWPHKHGSINEAGYEVVNARTEGFRKIWWRVLVRRITEAADAASRRRQRAIPANDEVSGRSPSRSNT